MRFHLPAKVQPLKALTMHGAAGLVALLASGSHLSERLRFAARVSEDEDRRHVSDLA